MAVFRTLVRHRTVKAVFLSEAKILSSDFTFIVNIISRFVVCTLEQTDIKNVIVENIHWALFEDAEVAEVKRPRNSKRRKFYYEK